MSNSVKIKVVSLNLWFGKELESAVEFLKSQKPDVILLQEVPFGVSQDLDEVNTQSFQVLSRELEMYSSFVPGWRIKNHDYSYEFGLAILTNLPVVSGGFEFYYRHFYQIEKLQGPGYFPGILQNLKVKVGDSLLSLMTTHFIWSLHPEVNEDQKRAINPLIELLEKEERLIFGGDLNTWQETEIYQKLSNVLVDDRPKGLKQTLNPRLHRTKGKELAVDYLFHKGDDIRLLDSYVPDVDISDHLPVVAEYWIE